MFLPVTIQSDNLDELLLDKRVVVAKVRNSRLKCKPLAVLELLNLLEAANPLFITNGPLGDVKGLVSIMVDGKSLSWIPERLAYSGYCNRFYLIDFDNVSQEEELDFSSINPFVFKQHPFSVRRLYTVDEDVFRNQAADKRGFLIRCGDQTIREIRGYRGNGTETGRRALAVEDCRLLVNLVCSNATKCFLEPFAGAGGLVYQARRAYPNMTIQTIDIDPDLAPGLQAYGAIHYTGHAESFHPNGVLYDAVASEVPFSQKATDMVCDAIETIDSITSSSCKMALMCSEAQAEMIEETIRDSSFSLAFSQKVNRKGTDVRIIFAIKNRMEYEDFSLLWHKLELLR